MEITPEQLKNFRTKTFITFAQATNKQGILIKLGITGKGAYMVIGEFRDSKFKDPQKAIDKFNQLIK